MNIIETPNYVWSECEDSRSLADNLAGELVGMIDAAILEHGNAVIALSGGSTPKPLFEALAEHAVDWSKVVVTLVDERWVPESHELSNAAFIKRYFLNNIPTGVRFVPLYQAAQTVEASYAIVLADYCDATGSSINNMRRFDIVVLGMGNDGHTASFFPDANNIKNLVSLDEKQPLLSCNSATTKVERITWSLPMLLNSAYLALHFTGSAKLDVFETAVKGGPIQDLPIRSVIFQDQTPLNVFFAD